MNININGKEPSIVGKKCQSFFLIQQQEKDVIINPVNSAYFKFARQWFQLCFDGNTVFWRENIAHQEPVNNDLSCCLVLLNLSELEGVVGSILESIKYESNEETISLFLNFTSGKRLHFKYYAFKDYTSINLGK